MISKNNLRLKGKYRFRVFDENGKLKTDQIFENVTTTLIRGLIANRLTDATPTSSLLIEYIAVGTGTNTPAITDTTLQTELARKAIASRTNADNIATCSTLFAAGEATGTIREVGVFAEGTAAADSGYLVSRSAVNVVVGALDSLFIDWELEISDA